MTKTPLTFSRRQILGFMALAAASTAAGIMLPPFFIAGLRDHATRAGKFYGAAVYSTSLDDKSFAKSLSKEINLLVPESELKWRIIQPSPGLFDFSGYDRLAAFARENTMGVRGHTLVWYHSNPVWVEERLKNRDRVEDMLRTHITATLRHTAPVIQDWDVVNEAVDHNSTRPDGLREGSWLAALGPDYIPLAFRLAQEAQPGARLVYNDYGMEYDDDRGAYRRRAVLALLTKLKRDNVPVHALGLQSHLNAARPLATDAMISFLKEVRALGLEVIVTELDLKTGDLSAEQAASYAARYLDVVQDDAPLKTLVTWGLSARYSYLVKQDPSAKAPLPLSADLKHEPLWPVLRDRWLRRA